MLDENGGHEFEREEEFVEDLEGGKGRRERPNYIIIIKM